MPACHFPHHLPPLLPRSTKADHCLLPCPVPIPPRTACTTPTRVTVARLVPRPPRAQTASCIAILCDTTPPRPLLARPVVAAAVAPSQTTKTWVSDLPRVSRIPGRRRHVGSGLRQSSADATNCVTVTRGSKRSCPCQTRKARRSLYWNEVCVPRRLRDSYRAHLRPTATNYITSQEKLNRQLQARLDELEAEIARLRTLNEKMALSTANGSPSPVLNQHNRPLSPPSEGNSPKHQLTSVVGQEPPRESSPEDDLM